MYNFSSLFWHPDTLDRGRKLNVHKTFRRRLEPLLNVLCTFNLRPMSKGISHLALRWLKLKRNRQNELSMKIFLGKNAKKTKKQKKCTIYSLYNRNVHANVSLWFTKNFAVFSICTTSITSTNFIIEFVFL